MKTRFNGHARAAWIVLWAAAAVLIGVLASCVPPTGAAGTEAGNFTLFLSGGPSHAKVISDTTIAKLSYELELSGPDRETIHYSAAPGTTSVTFSLAPGNWAVRVKAFKDGRPFGIGEKTVTVGDGVNEAVVPMYLFPVWYVDAVAGDNDNPGSEEAPLATVAKALEKIWADYAGGWSNNGDGDGNPVPARIVINGTVTAGPMTNGLVDISDGGMYDRYPPIILEGGAGGGTLNANNTNRVLFIRNADVTLGPDLTLTGGKVTTGNGGGVSVNSGKFTMTGGTITANIDDGSGGGVSVESGTFTMTGGTISGNKATGSHGGGVYVEVGTFTMSGGTIRDNESTNGFGGGVFMGDAGATFTMNDGTIENNAAANGNGGGVYVGNGGKLTLAGGTIGTNTASDGGGVYMGGNGATFDMIGGTISGNKANDSSYGYGGNGGGVYVGYNVTFAMKGGTIGGNTAKDSGGGVHVVSDGTFQMIGGTISGNIAANNGGGVSVGYGGTFRKEGGYSAVIYRSNIATSGSGQAVYVSDGSKKRDATAEAEDYLDSATPGPLGGWELSSGYIQSLINGVSGTGSVDLEAGTYDMDSQVEITGGRIITLTTESNAEVILKRNSAFKGDMIKVDNGGLILDVAGTGDSLILDGNGDEVAADGSLVRVDGGDLTMNAGVTLRNNKNSTNGGGVYFEGGDFYMNGGTIGGSAAVNKAYRGGGVYVNGGSFYMITSPNTQIKNNQATDNGGGVYVAAGGSFIMGQGTIGGATADANSAVSGGGVYVAGGSFSLNTAAVVSGNTVTDDGGGVYVAGGTFSLNGTAKIRDNNATGNGGGVYFESGTFYMIGNNITVSISGNTATGNGGGVYVANGSFDWGNSYVTSSIGDNNATNGGGVYVAGGSFLLQGEAKISGNTATTNGGGVYVGGGSFTKLTDTIIYGDDASPGQKNTAGSGNGHAAYVTDGPKRRNSTAGTLVGLDSATSGPPGGWDGSSGYIQSEIDSASPGGTITLPAGTYDMTGKVTVDKNIIITTETGAEVILKRNSSFTGGMIEADVTTDGLTLKAGTGGSLTLDGNGSMVTAESHLVKVAAGDLTIESGVTLRGNKITDPGIGGSGVYFSGGTFTMSGGTIGGSGADKNTAGASGGGVFVNAGTFNMSDGTISGNESSTGNGGGVYFAGAIFNMTGGTISGNKASSGGGVYFAGTTFNMSGGTIGGSGEGNQAVNGGGVYVNNGTFEMSGGTIHGNTATSSGGGVYVESGQFIMTGGTISGNKATSGEGPGGGGVYVDSGGTFQKKDTANPGDSGTIYGNTGDSNGNIANGGNNGHAVYVPVGGLKRNSTADPSVNLDSSNTTNWE